MISKNGNEYEWVIGRLCVGAIGTPNLKYVLGFGLNPSPKQIPNADEVERSLPIAILAPDGAWLAVALTVLWLTGSTPSWHKLPQVA